MTSVAFAGQSQAALSEDAWSDLNQVVVQAESAILEAVGATVSLRFALASATPRVAIGSEDLRALVVALCSVASTAAGPLTRLALETRGVNDAGLASAPRLPEPCARLIVWGEPSAAKQPCARGSAELGLAALNSLLLRIGARLEQLTGAQGEAVYVVHLPQPAPAQSSGRMPVSPAAGTDVILLIEDEPQVQAVTARILRAFGYSVLTAHNERSALAQAEQHGDAIGLVVSDLVLPGVSGTELVRRLRSPCANARVLYVSGYSPEHIGALVDGASFLRKPYTAEELIQNVRALLAAAIH